MIGEASTQIVGADTFVGHAGGDDFVVVVPPEQATATAQQIVQAFDDMVPALYDVDDRTNGYVEVTNRRGDPPTVPADDPVDRDRIDGEAGLPALRGSDHGGDGDEAVHEGLRCLVVVHRSSHELTAER